MADERAMPVGPEIIVVRTGTANLASVCAALRRAGATPICSDDPEVVARAELVVLPGVGAFGAAVGELRRAGLDAAVIERVERARPLLAICLGLQVLCESSEESPGVRGLGVIPAQVTRFRADGPARVPHFGWNTITPDGACSMLNGGRAYFANSYKIDGVPTAWAGAASSHAGGFVAAVERGAVLACQFHPELSGRWGAGLIERWINRASLQRSDRCLHSV